MAQTPDAKTLQDGAPFRAAGALTVKFQGWHRHLVLPLPQPVLVNFGADMGRKRVSAIELNPQGHYDEIARFAGKRVSAEGKLQIEGSSPYYWNGVMLMASAVHLPDGRTLVPDSTSASVPAATRAYMVTVTMVPHRYTWQRTAVDLQTDQALPEAAVDGCGLNGGGDVMNCFCSDGFVPVRAGAVARAFSPANWRSVPRSQLNDPAMAQFLLPDPDATKPQTIQVVCTRKGEMLHD